ncbi:Copper amine oxidase 1 [Neolecta irregularis DAH-3]|uniref:Amine oxidase n=1 Tax=Neolecta irregularis (strain DAH-3) TaxID=1198029 RepID=A0A1U7LW12_NEOID|nr:Copper amine oxidase 1 [Neolecta irregularis DAH-3]|eukprot:OLL26824.1 Copper amine oxidase 1 [Neolecta irregularis DAH-3]
MFFYLQLNDNPQHNLYAHPLDFSCVLDQFEGKVLKIVRLPLTEEPNSFAKDDQKWVQTEDSEYAPDFQKEMRTDAKPIVVTQPEGTSYKITRNIVKWQKWEFHLGYNDREGPVLYNLTYGGRPTFYRLSLCEMVVPYGDPRAPYHRKAAFDLGDFGAGPCANNLQLGCDCLGVIKYFDGYITTQDGQALKKENSVCLHEQDAGIGWKHTNFRTGAVTVVRSRELVIQTILTVANYEYVFAWVLDQAAGIHFEVRATGILSTVPISKDIKSTPWGISVTPGCFAPVHQHIFSLRIDPAIDGYDGTHVSYEDTLPMPLDEHNPYGVGYGVYSTKIETSGYFDTDVSKNRVVKIASKDTKSDVTGKNRAYKLVPAATQLMLAHPESLHQQRAEFADHAFWVTKHRDDELYAGSDHTNQSRGGHGIRSWAKRNEDLEDKSVLWHTFGFSHSPRLEDFPVMPCETLRVALKPNGFFDRNPLLDVPGDNKEKNGSVLYDQACCAK